LFDEKFVGVNATPFEHNLMPGPGSQRDRSPGIFPGVNTDEVRRLCSEGKIPEVMFEIGPRLKVIVDRVEFYNGMVNNIITFLIDAVNCVFQRYAGPGGAANLVGVAMNEPVSPKRLCDFLFTRQQRVQVEVLLGGSRRKPLQSNQIRS